MSGIKFLPAVFVFATMACVIPTTMAQDVPIEKRVASTDSENEVLAIAFIEKHHPELIKLLDSLRNRKSKEYQAAIRETHRVRTKLENMSSKDPEGYQLELDAWKITSQINFALAKHVAKSTAPHDDQALIDLLEKQRANLVRKHEYEQARLKKRLAQLDELLGSCRDDPDAWTAQQLAKFKRQADSQRKNKVGSAKSTP